MTAELTKEQRDGAFAPPPARPRAQRGRGQQPPPDQPSPGAPRVPSPAPAGVSAAVDKRKQRKLRAAGQELLPVLSKLAKLADDVEMCTDAIVEALTAGVDPADLQREFQYFAGKAGVDWSLIPAQIQGALATAPQGRR